MNFTRKLKTLAVAVVAATASQMSFASLLHFNQSTGNGSFFFVAGNDENDSYVQSLANGNGPFRLNSAVPITEQDFTLSASLANVLAGSNPFWTVLSADNVPSSGQYPGLRITSTTTHDTTDGGGPALVRNAALLQGLQFLQLLNSSGFFPNADSLVPSVAGTGVYDPGATGDTTDAANFFVAGPGSTLNSRIPTESAPLVIGAELDAWLFEAGVAASPLPIAQRFGTVTQEGIWTFNGATLHYGSAPAVVPVPAAVWLLGSALVGVTGVRRRKA